MDKKDRHILIGFIAVLILIALIILSCNAFSLSVFFHGYEPNAISTYEESFNANGDMIRIVHVRERKSGKEGLAEFVRNDFGWWSEWAPPTPRDENGWLKLFRTRPSGWRSYGVHQIGTEWEQQLWVVGDNAIAPIEFKEEQLPSNTTVSIDQSGSSYRLRFVWFGLGLADQSPWNELQNTLYHTLQLNGCVP